jgi:hypothetical protein
MSVGKKENQNENKSGLSGKSLASYIVFYKPKAESSLQIGINTVTS